MTCVCATHGLGSICGWPKVGSHFNFFIHTNYSKIFGTAMGSTISSTVANLAMENMEKEIRSKLDYVPHVYKTYVDDCILCIPVNKLDYTHLVFSSYHPRIQFTIEKQTENTLRFFDIKINYNENGQIETDWFTKSIWSLNI